MPDSAVSAAWLDTSVDELAQRIVRRALLDVGIVEMPPGSNRSPRIDTYVTTVGSPLGSRWCAAAVAAVALKQVSPQRVLGYVAPRPQQD